MDFTSFLNTLASKPSDGHLATASSLIYTLNSDQNDLSFDEFVIVVKSLHSFRVQEITPDPINKSVIVKLNYNCSMKNVRAKAGNLPVTVFKVNPNIAPAELSTLETLRNKFRFGVETTEEEHNLPEPPKKRKHKSLPRTNIQVQSEEH